MGMLFLLIAATVRAVNVRFLLAGRLYVIAAGHVSSVIEVPVTVDVNIVRRRPPASYRMDITIYRIDRSAGGAILSVSYVIPATRTVVMFLFGTVTTNRTVDMFLLTANDTFIGMDGMFLSRTNQFRNTFRRMGMPQPTDLIVASIAVGVGGGQNTVAGSLEGNGIIVSGIICIHDG